MLTIPSFRQDLLREADIAEEVARFYGYANIPSTLPSNAEAHGGLSYGFVINNKVREIVKAYGFSESMTYSFESPKVFDKLLLPEDAPERNAIKISNPLGEDFSIETAVVVGEMYKNNGEWKFNAIGSGFQGGLFALCKNYGVNV